MQMDGIDCIIKWAILGIKMHIHRLQRSIHTKSSEILNSLKMRCIICILYLTFCQILCLL